MRIDRIVAAAFVVLVSTAIIGFSTGSTGASFTGTTTNPGQILNSQNVTPPASFTSATAAIAGRIDLVWTATASPAGGHTLTYLVLRGPVGGPYVQIGTTAGLTYSDTPGADGTYEYVIQTKIAQGAGFFTSANSATKSNKSDRTAPVMSITCNGGSCAGNAAGWFNVNVTAVSTGNDGAGTGMASVTTSRDGAANGTTVGSSRTDAALTTDSATHSIAYFGTDAVGNVSGTTTKTIKIDKTAPTAATAIADSGAGQNNGELGVSWTRGTDALSGIASQTLRRSAAGAGACPAVSVANYPNVVAGVTAASTSVLITGLVSASSYCFYIVTTDAAGNATNSAASARLTAN